MKYVLLSSLGNCQKGSNFYFKNIFISELDILTFLLYHSCVKIKSSLRLLHSLSPRLMERPIRVQSKHLLADLSNIFFFFFFNYYILAQSLWPACWDKWFSFRRNWIHSCRSLYKKKQTCTKSHAHSQARSEKKKVISTNTQPQHEGTEKYIWKKLSWQ